jgi:hypothetical protein
MMKPLAELALQRQQQLDRTLDQHRVIVSFLPSERVMLRALRTSKIRGVQLAIVVDNEDGQLARGRVASMCSRSDSAVASPVVAPRRGSR